MDPKIKRYGGTLYHGTTQAVIDYARQQGNRLGTMSADVHFTPDFEIARAWASDWANPESRRLLREFFLDDIPLEDDEGSGYWHQERVDLVRLLKQHLGRGAFQDTTVPVVLELGGVTLGQLRYERSRNGVYEHFSRRGPINIGKARVRSVPVMRTRKREQLLDDSL